MNDSGGACRRMSPIKFKLAQTCNNTKTGTVKSFGVSGILHGCTPASKNKIEVKLHMGFLKDKLGVWGFQTERMIEMRRP